MDVRRKKTAKLIYVDPDLYNKLKIFAFVNGLTISEFLEIVIECLEKRDYQFFEKMKRWEEDYVEGNAGIKKGNNDRD